MTHLDLLVHPVRSRIIGALAGRTLTTRDLARALPDVPVPTLYRQVRILDEAGVIVRTGEKKVRGGMERSYTLAEGGGTIDGDMPFSADQRVGMLANFCNVAVHAYRTYTESGGQEMAWAQMRSLYLTEAEAETLRQSLRDLFAPYQSNGPGDDRKRRIVAVMDQPDFEPTPEEEP
ncbi:ArsR family transcriptional regulator [bacterium]|nr:MAG: ArsR family transcriptional regulator [bacterium]